ncbi:MAG: rod shape-determining protein MreD [Clostridiaceae bacterium]|nr:rod shape-determining protein MreD [Clostridiaceae bacterium]
MMRNRVAVRKIIVYAVYVMILGLLQVTLPDNWMFQGCRPDLTLILAVLCGYMFGSSDGFVIGLASGLMRDLLAGRSLGLGMLLLMYIALLSSVLFRQFFRRNILLGLAQIEIMTVLYAFLMTMITFMIPLLPDVTHSWLDLAKPALLALPAQMIANLLAGIPLIFLLAFLGPYRRGSRTDDPDEEIVGGSVWRVN